MTPDTKETKHLPYGGSTMAMTLACPNWIAQAEKLKPVTEAQPPGYAADEGSMLHAVMEHCLNTRNKRKPDQRLTPGYFLATDTRPAFSFGQATMTEELSEKAFAAMFATLELLDKYGVGPRVGKPLPYVCEPFVEYIPELAGGSIDLFAVAEGQTAILIDFKFGRRRVKAEDNPQLLFYALSADAAGLIPPGVKNLVLAIVQPDDDGNCEPDVWETPIAVLDEFERKVETAIKNRDSTPRCGDHCLYCPAKPTCPAQLNKVSGAIKLAAAEGKALAEAMSLVADVRAWADAVEKTALAALELGNPIEGFKLVNKRPVRKWAIDEKAIREALVSEGLAPEEIAETKLLSPAQMEKLIKKKGLDAVEIGDYIEAKSSGLTIASAGDKRPEALPTRALAEMAK